MNELPLGEQLRQMMQMVLCGTLVMLTVQQHQMLIKAGRFRYRSRMLADFLFCVLWALALWLILLAVSGGLIRNYILLGFAAGVVLYQCLFRRPMEGVCRAGANAILVLFRWLNRILILPWHLVYRLVRGCCVNLAEKFLREKQESDAAEENITENENNFSS